MNPISKHTLNMVSRITPENTVKINENKAQFNQMVQILCKIAKADHNFEEFKKFLVGRSLDQYCESIDQKWLIDVAVRKCPDLFEKSNNFSTEWFLKQNIADELTNICRFGYSWYESKEKMADKFKQLISSYPFRINLSGEIFYVIHISNVCLDNVDLSKSIFYGTVFCDVSFNDSNLSNVIFNNVEICDCSFKRTNLIDAKFNNLVINGGVDFRWSNLSRSIWDNTIVNRKALLLHKFKGAILLGVNLNKNHSISFTLSHSSKDYNRTITQHSFKMDGAIIEAHNNSIIDMIKYLSDNNLINWIYAINSIEPQYIRIKRKALSELIAYSKSFYNYHGVDVLSEFLKHKISSTPNKSIQLNALINTDENYASNQPAIFPKEITQKIKSTLYELEKQDIQDLFKS